MEGREVVGVAPYWMLDATPERSYMVEHNGLTVTQGKCGVKEGLLDEQFDNWMRVFAKVLV